ncbi:MAG: LUD domain-containing protein [Candidatus Symbiothrix sp.]|jgi:L-lactate dehydrogenase complex protein LldG|nr:LUD domain-containing protein [Candidatus Symbiothrix sp.]
MILNEMSSKDEILDNIRKNIKATYDLPEITIEAIRYADKVSQFTETIQNVGGQVVLLEKGQDLNSCIQSLYPEAKVIASNVHEITIANRNPDTVETPYQLNGTDLAIIQGELGVAENGCIWIPQNVKEKAVYFISEHLVILLDKDNIVNNMHEAYRQIQIGAYGFGMFISGPSKTADIEQALVIGAHGAKGVTVILISH